MTIANKYIQQCKSLFPVYGKLERTFLNRLKVQVNEHLDLFPDISYNELVKQFGSPREVVMEYYDNIEDVYQSYTTYQALNLIKDQQIIYEKQGTIEETK